MYVRRVELENNGPIEFIDFSFPFKADGTPNPVVFVGQNGAGKSILISHIVNAMIDAKGSVYDDAEVEEGRVYKLRSPIYISHGKDFYRSYIYFDDGFKQGEIQALHTRKHFEETKGFTPTDSNWSHMPDDSASVFTSNFREREVELRDKLSKSSMLYFPANRFEDPAWLNVDNLRNVSTYGSFKRVHGVSGRPIINDSPLKANQNWLLDVIYDSYAIERLVRPILTNDGIPLPLLLESNGPATQLRKSIEDFILRLLGIEGPLSWSVGTRGHRSISITADAKPVSGNLFSLSTGQTALLNVFLTLIRDCDLSNAAFAGLHEISGIVVIDEIDVHLHTELQHTILPELIAIFPKVQFIMTTHSPLFVLGLEKKLGNDGFSLIELPHGNPISVERFSEFEAAYRHFKETASFERDVRTFITESQMPILFAEGSIDIDYIRTAAVHLGREASVERFCLLDANGSGGLDKIWKYFDANIARLSNKRVTLLYDCDVNKVRGLKPGVCRIVLPQQEHSILKGIENLFPDALIERAMNFNPAFIDITHAHQKRVRGDLHQEPAHWEVNSDEKRNLADWIITNATVDDFSHFSIVFDLIDTAYQDLSNLPISTL